MLQRYVAPAVQRAIEARALEGASCFADLSVFFVGLSGVDLGAPHPGTGELWGQEVMRTVQRCVFDHEGAVNKFVMDDKGALLLCAWGLPPMAHVDDPYRAAAAAMELSQALAALGARAHIGVATGKVFAGVIGPPHRCEFSMLGDGVNLAARLMGKAPFGGVLCDRATFEAAQASAANGGVVFEALGPIRVKGKEALVEVFRPLADARAAGEARSLGKRTSSAVFDGGATVLGQGHMRRQERERLLAMQATLFEGGGGVMLLTGDAGSGKSELAKLALKGAGRFGARLVESRTPKTKGPARDVADRPCLELSQVLGGLLGEPPGLADLVAAQSADGAEAAWWLQLARGVKGAADPGVAAAAAPGGLLDAYVKEWAALDAAEAGEEGARDDLAPQVAKRSSSVGEDDVLASPEVAAWKHSLPRAMSADEEELSETEEAAGRLAVLRAVTPVTRDDMQAHPPLSLLHCAQN